MTATLKYQMVTAASLAAALAFGALAFTEWRRLGEREVLAAEVKRVRAEVDGRREAAAAAAAWRVASAGAAECLEALLACRSEVREGEDQVEQITAIEGHAAAAEARRRRAERAAALCEGGGTEERAGGGR